MSIEERKAELVREIETAFQDVQLGKGISLHQAKAIDNHGSDDEIESARESDPWKRWRDIPLEALEECNSGLLAHMDSEAFLFHLPAYMRAAVKNFPIDPDGFYHGCIYHLTREPQYVIAEYGLSPQQIKAIAHFWEFQFDFEKTNHDSHLEKRLLEWLAAAQSV